MFRRVLTLAAAALLLGGCYTSSYLLLDMSAGVRPLAAGTYSNGSARYDLTLRDDNAYDLYRYNTGGTQAAPERLFLARAPELENGSNGVYLYAEDNAIEGWIYGVLVMQGGAVYEMHPDCAVAADAGIAHGEGASAECDFTDPGALRRALVRFYRTASWGVPYYRQ